METGVCRHRTTLPAGLRAWVWIKAWHFFSRDSAQDCCWLWLLDGEGRVHTLRLNASCHGRDEFLPELCAWLAHWSEAPASEPQGLETIQFLPQAPVVPLTRWAVSWGHPVQQSIRAFADKLDGDVLAALGRLEVPGPFFGSVGNYNRLALLPQPTRRHRLQALEEFPPLVAPVLLELRQRPDMFGARGAPMAYPARHGRGKEASLLESIDRGRDLIGALAAHYGVGRSLVRSPLLRTPTASGSVRRGRLPLLDAMPAHARPREYAALERWLSCLDALPVRARSVRDASRLAAVFAPGWRNIWKTLAARFRPLEPALRDTRDLLRAALEEVELPPELEQLDVETLGLAWLCRRGPLSLLAASRRWHEQPVVERLPDDGLPDAVTAILGELKLPEGHAGECTTRWALIEEGGAMHHCVGGYWMFCALHATRIVHLRLAEGEQATAQYDWDRRSEHPGFELAALRGPCNQEPGESMHRFAEHVEQALNDPEKGELRARAVHETREARARHEHAQGSGGTFTLRPLDRRSRHELELVLDWCLKQEDWHARPDELFGGPVAGFAHADGPELLGRLDAGDRLELVREPRNPHDPLAVRVDWTGHKLGYVPRTDNARVARRLDAGARLVASVVAVYLDDAPWRQLEIAVSPEMPDRS